MSTNKRVFTLRLDDGIFDRIESLARLEHRSMTNLIEFAVLKYLEEAGSRMYPSSQAGASAGLYVQETVHENGNSPKKQP